MLGGECDKCHNNTTLFDTPEHKGDHIHPESWEAVKEALARGAQVRDAEGDLVHSVALPGEVGGGDGMGQVTFWVRGRADSTDHRQTYHCSNDRIKRFVASVVVTEAEMDETMRSIAEAFGPVERAHLIDDHARTIAGGLKPLAPAMDLLSDAMHAIQNGRQAAALDLVERAYGMLSDSLTALSPTPDGVPR